MGKGNTMGGKELARGEGGEGREWKNDGRGANGRRRQVCPLLQLPDPPVRVT